MGFKLKEPVVTETKDENVNDVMEDYTAMDEYNAAMRELDEKMLDMQKRKHRIEEMQSATPAEKFNRLENGYLNSVRSLFDFSDNPIAIYVLCGIIVIAAMLVFSKAQSAYKESKLDSVTLPAIITDVRKDEKIVNDGGKNRWVTDYKYTYEWEDENGEIVVGSRTSSDYIFEEGQEVTVTVMADDYRHEIDSNSSAKSNMMRYIFIGIGALGLATLLFIKTKQKE